MSELRSQIPIAGTLDGPSVRRSPPRLLGFGTRFGEIDPVATDPEVPVHLHVALVVAVALTEAVVVEDKALLLSRAKDMWLYLSESDKFYDFGNEDALIWHEANIPFDVWGPSSSRSYSLKYIPSEPVRNNGSLYAHVFLAHSGYSPDPSDPEYKRGFVFGRTYPIVIYSPKSKAGKRRSSLGSEEGGRVPEMNDS